MVLMLLPNPPQLDHHRTEVQVLEGDVPAEAEAPAAPGAYFIQALKRSQLEVFGLARTAWARSLSC